MSHSVKIIKLVNGETVIGIIEDEDLDLIEIDEERAVEFADFCFMIHFPFKLNCIYSREGKRHEIFLEDWMPYSKDTFTPVLKDKVIAITEPSKDVLDLYDNHQESLSSEEINPVIPSKRKIESSPEQTKSKKDNALLKSITFKKEDIQ